MTAGANDSTRSQVARAFKALGDPIRLAIVDALRERERTVTELAQATGSAQPSVSKHLQVLHAAAIVRRRRSGLFTCYRLADSDVSAICLAMMRRVDAAGSDLG